MQKVVSQQVDWYECAYVGCYTASDSEIQGSTDACFLDLPDWSSRISLKYSLLLWLLYRWAQARRNLQSTHLATWHQEALKFQARSCAHAPNSRAASKQLGSGKFGSYARLYWKRRCSIWCWVMMCFGYRIELVVLISGREKRRAE